MPTEMGIDECEIMSILKTTLTYDNGVVSQFSESKVRGNGRPISHTVENWAFFLRSGWATTHRKILKYINI